MELVELRLNHKGKATAKLVGKEVIILRRMRIFRKIDRQDAGKAIDRGPKSIERFENGRQTLTEEQQKALVRRYRFTWQEFLAFADGKEVLPELPPRYVFKSQRVPREEGRKYQKVDSKEARVLRALRKMAKLTQPAAAARLNLSRSCIDHLEAGRVEITKERIEAVVHAYGYKMEDFNELLNAPLLRDQVIEECMKILEGLDTDKLRAVKALLDNFR